MSLSAVRMDGCEKQAPVKDNYFWLLVYQSDWDVLQLFDVLGSVLESCVGHYVIHLVEPTSETGVLAW